MKRDSKELKEENKLLEKTLKADPKNFDSIVKIAYNSFFLNDLKKALKFYKKALALQPQLDYINYNVGNVYHFLKNNKKAAHYYLMALSLNPRYVEALNNMGIIYFEMQQPKLAFKMHNTALEVSPNHPEAYHHIGILHREVNSDFELSMWYLKKAIRLDYNYAPNHYQLGLTYKKMNELEFAKSEFGIALQLMPNYKDAKKELAKV